MLSKSNTTAFVRIVLILVLLAGFLAIAPQNAAADAINDTVSDPSSGDGCVPDGGWMWASGPSLPEVAAQVQWELSDRGIAAAV